MTGNIALDVTIGLVFIYTLYSLFTTTIIEFIATLFGLRARNLKLAVGRMLDDDPDDLDNTVVKDDATGTIGTDNPDDKTGGKDKPNTKKKNAGVLRDAFYQTPVIKYLSNNRLFYFFRKKRNPSYIDAGTFSQAVIYLLKGDGQSGEPAKNTIRQSLEKYKNTETGKYLLFLFNEASGDIEKFTGLLENWFDATMARCIGWYKKNLTFLTFAVGLLIAMLFNVDTIQIAKKLSTDPKAREQYVELAGQMASNPMFTNPTPAFDTSLQKRLLNDTTLFNRLGKDSATFRQAVSDSTYRYITHTQKELTDRMDSLYSLSQHSQNILSIERHTCTPWFFDNWKNLLGCFITAIALSLGAPFWFDLLNRLMKLRNSMSPGKTAGKNTGKKTTEENTKPAVG